MSLLLPQPLTSEAFAPFGDVIQVHEAGGVYENINNNTCHRYNGLAVVDVVSGTSGISIFRATPRVFPFKIDLLERHPLGSQAFMPLGNARFIIIAAADSGHNEPDWNSIQVFSAGAGQGISFHRNIWHHPLLAVDETGDFLVVDRLSQADSGDNLHECTAPADCNIEIHIKNK